MLPVLSDREIRKRLGKDLVIHPMIHADSQINGCKVDLHLSGVFYEMRRTAIDCYDPLSHDIHDFRRELILPLGEYLVLHPGDLILAPTFENFKMPRNLLGILQGRSSLGRLGVIVHATASFVDPGFTGTVTLELSNLGQSPVKLYTLARVASIAFLQTESVERAYSDGETSPFTATSIATDHYASPKSEASRHHLDWEYDLIRKFSNRPQAKE